MAARFHKTEIAEVLLDKGANVNCLYSGMTPLDIAAKMGYDDLVTLLTQHGGKTATELSSNNEQSSVMTKANTVVFTKDSNGYDWQRAGLQTRQQFCETIAAAMSKEFKHDFTADFYYGALDSFYNSSDPNILKQNIHQVVGLTTSAAIAGQ
jgi:ankyrin repeat protein